MKIFWSILILVVAVQWTWAQVNDGGVQVAGTNDKCAEFCSTTFKVEGASMKSCQQGCRLFAVLQFADRSSGRNGLVTEPNASAISVSCQKECNDAYKDAGLKAACVDGCKHQTPFTTGHLKIVMDDSMPMFSFANKMMSDAFGKMNEFQSHMMDKFGKMSDWFKNDPFSKFESDLQESNIMNIFNRLDAQVRNMFNELTKSSISELPTAQNDPPKPNGQKFPASGQSGSTVNPLFAYAKNLADSRNKNDALVRGSQVGQAETKSKPDPVASNGDANGEPILVIKIVSSNGLLDDDDGRMMMGPMMDRKKIWTSFTQESLNEKPHDPSPPIMADEKNYFGPAGAVDSDDTWLACFARRTQNLPMLTRWLLCLALMLSILCMIYLCLAVMRASQQRRRRQFMEYTSKAHEGLMPPPTYEKVIPDPGFKFQESEEAPPPAYEAVVGPFPIHKESEPVVKQI